jgi:hypothetical protein
MRQEENPMIDKAESRTQNRETNVRGDQTGSMKGMTNEGAKKHVDPMASDAMQSREKRKGDEQSKSK